MSLKDFLKEVLELGQDDVFKVEVKDSFSFFNTEKEHQEKVLAFFTDFKDNGRFVNVEVSQDRGRGGNRSRGGRRDDRKGGDRRNDENVLAQEVTDEVQVLILETEVRRRRSDSSVKTKTFRQFRMPNRLASGFDRPRRSRR